MSATAATCLIAATKAAAAAPQALPWIRIAFRIAGLLTD
jgi:hypothetical protein